ncbi:hypothetical protein QM565_27695 [Geitlerinema splendidum]|jgi:Tol biopolymer transport system component|nr:hypothetical protein [Geitlerinema splendidum]
MFPTLIIRSLIVLLLVCLLLAGAARAVGHAWVCPADPCGTLLYHTNRIRSFDIFLLDLPRTVTYQLPEQGSSFTGTWSPDGQRIAYWSDGEGMPAIYVRDIFGGGRVTRLPGSAYPGTEIAWSPDGREIAYVINESGYLNIVASSLETTEMRRLTDGRSNLAPAWSPDGGWIAYRSTLSSNTSIPDTIWVMRAADGGSPRMIGSASPLLSIAWSPDSRAVLFSRFEPRNAAFMTATLVQIDGGETQVVRRWSMNSRSPWTRDGDHVALVARREDAPTTAGVTRYEIGMVELATGDWKPLLPIFDSRGTPVVSPDGRWVAFVSANMRTPGISLIHSQTGAVHPITHSALDEDPAWQPR